MKREPKQFRTLIAAFLLSLCALLATFAQTERDSRETADTSALDMIIAGAEARAHAAGATGEDKRAAAAAYLERGNVYYGAGVPRLYKFALADFRRALKYRPDLAEAREKLEQIEEIYRSLGRPIPPNGNESAEALHETAAKAVRVELKGEPASALMKGSVEAGGVRDYVLSARAGQSVTARLESEGHPLGFNFYRLREGVPIRLALDAQDWTLDVRQGGDYMIRVGPAREKIDFTLKMSVGKIVETRKF